MVKKRKDNVDFITSMMKFHTPIMQAFILEGVKKYCDLLIKHKDQYIKENKDSMLCPVAWVGCAELYTKKYKKHLDDNYPTKSTK